MTYTNKELERQTTRDRVRRYRSKQKQGVTGVTECKRCKGKGYIEEQSGLVIRGCPDCKGK